MDYPLEDDDYIEERRAGYAVTHDGKNIGTYDTWSRASAALYIMREGSNFRPNIWYVNERGNTTLCVFEGHILRETNTAYV